MTNKTQSSIFVILSLIIILFFAIYKFKNININKKISEIIKSEKQKKLKIITTTGMIEDAVINIGGDHIEVKALMGPGIDPHSYKAKPRDLTNLKKADIIFYNGLHLEGKMSDVLENFSKIKTTYPVSNALADYDIMKDKEFSEGVDPHIWFDVLLWKKVVNYICSILQEKLPQKAEIFKNNKDTYLKKLDLLHKFIKDLLEKVPEEQRVLITAHDAFGYFGRAYKLEVKGLQGISTTAEYGLKDITDLIRFIIERKIKAIFIETSVPEKPIKAVIEGCENNGHKVILGGPIYSDAMGPKNTNDGTYIGMLEANVKTIVRGLKIGIK